MSAVESSIENNVLDDIEGINKNFNMEDGPAIPEEHLFYDEPRVSATELAKQQFSDPFNIPITEKPIQTEYYHPKFPNFVFKGLLDEKDSLVIQHELIELTVNPYQAWDTLKKLNQERLKLTDESTIEEFDIGVYKKLAGMILNNIVLTECDEFKTDLLQCSMSKVNEMMLKPYMKQLVANFDGFNNRSFELMVTNHTKPYKIDNHTKVIPKSSEHELYKYSSKNDIMSIPEGDLRRTIYNGVKGCKANIDVSCRKSWTKYNQLKTDLKSCETFEDMTHYIDIFVKEVKKDDSLKTTFQAESQGFKYAAIKFYGNTKAKVKRFVSKYAGKACDASLTMMLLLLYAICLISGFFLTAFNWENGMFFWVGFFFCGWFGFEVLAIIDFKKCRGWRILFFCFNFVRID